MHISTDRSACARIVALLATLSMILSGCHDDPRGNAPVDAEKPWILGAKERRTAMLGRWHGSAPTKDGGRRKWLMERFPDGTFEVQFVTVLPDGRVQHRVERGLWGIAGNVYFTITRSYWKDGLFVDFNPDNASLYDAYDVLALDAQHFRYRGVETGSVFEVQRVTEDFMLPAEPR